MEPWQLDGILANDDVLGEHSFHEANQWKIPVEWDWRLGLAGLYSAPLSEAYEFQTGFRNNAGKKWLWYDGVKEFTVCEWSGPIGPIYPPASYTLRTELRHTGGLYEDDEINYIIVGHAARCAAATRVELYALISVQNAFRPDRAKVVRKRFWANKGFDEWEYRRSW